MSRFTVVIPAKSEEERIGAALEALANQVDVTTGRALAPGTFDVIVYCNDCDDDTAGIARRVAAASSHVAIDVVETRLPHDVAHVGGARKAALDLAVARIVENGDGIVASTDADTVVSPTWISATLQEMAHVDAVAGFVVVKASERDAMLAPMRLLYDLEVTYRHLLGAVCTAIDPLPYEAVPQHDSFVGASFAVTTRAYVATGGLPPLSHLEDLAFCDALVAIDARVRHSFAVRAYTSARTIARVDGGFASLLASMTNLAASKRDYLVRSARASIEDAQIRSLLRAVRAGRHDAGRLRSLEALTGIGASEIVRLASGARTFGTLWLHVRARSPQSGYPDEPIQSAIGALRRAAEDGMPFDPTRSSVASGAG